MPYARYLAFSYLQTQLLIRCFNIYSRENSHALNDPYLPDAVSKFPFKQQLDCTCVCSLCIHMQAVQDDHIQRNLRRRMERFQGHATVEFAKLTQLLETFKTCPSWMEHLAQQQDSFTLICNGKSSLFF